MHFKWFKRMFSLLLCVIMLGSLLQVKEASAARCYDHSKQKTIVTKQATCGKTGTREIRCKNCNYLVRTETIPATGNHSWGGWNTTRSATCTVGGTKSRSCNTCGKTETDNIAPLGHNSDKTEYTAPTCGSDGYTIKKCSRCQNVMSRTVHKATGNHSWGNWVTVKSPNCTEGGTRKHTCNTCGATASENMAAWGHNSNGTKTVPATCGKDGYTAKTCTNCGIIMSSTPIKATGKHSWGSWVDVKSANCTEGGTRKHTCNTCGATASENVAALGHDTKGGTKTVAATCTAAGYSVATCSRCKREQGNKTTIPALGHSWGSWIDVKAANCTEGGTRKHTCNRCGTTASENVAALGHDSKGGTKTVAATCTDAGYTVATCSRCKREQGNKTTIPALGHSWGSWIDVKAANCTEGGTRKHTCSTCGKTASENVAALGHNSDGSKTVPPTCETEGYTAKTCTRCGTIVSKTVLAVPGHSWSAWSTTKDPTCTIGGSKQRKCTKCGKTDTANIAPLGHNSNGTKTVAATCGKEGYTAKTCTNCGNIMSRTVIPPTGNHSWGGWVPVKNPTCTEGGTRKHTCNNCGTTTSENMAPLGHTWGNWVVTKEAKCTEEGTKKRSCSTCGISATESITAPGHTWGSWIDVKSANCTEGGTRKHSCTKCGTTTSENVAPLGHTSTGVTKTVDATCTADGYKAILCNRCNKELSRTVIPSPGHVFGDWITVKAENCTEGGTRKHSCTKCGLTTSENVNALGHSVTGLKNVVNATCTTDGYTAIICNRCNKEVSRTVHEKLGHDWGSWVKVKDEACETTGLRYHTCQRCKKTVTETIDAKGHSVTGQRREKKPTCTEDGYVAIICNDCGKEMPGSTVLQKTGHKLGRIEEVIPSTCETTGTGLNHCTNPNCTYSVSVVLSKKEHHPVPFTVAATCLKEGMQGTRCMYCNKIFGNTTTLPKTDHVYGERILYPSLCTETEDVYYTFCKYCGTSKAVYEAKEKVPDEEYYIILDANGGKGTMKTLYFTGNYRELPECAFKKDACVFTCWSTSPDSNSGFSYNPGDLYPRTDAPITLYANWDPIVYTIEYHYDYPGCPDSIKEGIMYGVETQTRVLTRKGYKLVGWKGYTDGGKQLNFTPGQIVKNLTVNNNVTVHLHAQWEKQEGTYTVTFFDGTRGVGSVNADLGAKIKTIKYYKNGWYCMGWSTTPDGPVFYESDTKYEFKEDTSLYAVWYQYTVSYDANGGTGAPDSQTVKDGGLLTISTKKLTRTGYTFSGWSYRKTEQNLDFEPGATYDAGESITLYAVWDPIEYKLKLDYGYPNAKPYTIPMPYDYVYYLPIPTRTGFKFAGWKGYTDGGKLLTFAGGTPVSKLTSNADVTVCLKGSWARDDSYTVVTCMDGSVNVASAAAENGKKVKMPVYYDPKTGMKVSSWNTKADGSGVSYTPGVKYQLSESITVYAIWGLYSITYDANKGSGAPDRQYVANNKTTTISTKVPSRTGYQFKGWAYESDATDSDFKGGVEFKECVSITLYAVWKPIEYTVTFNPNYVGAPKIANAAGVYGYNVYMPKPTREGFKFTGWKGYFNGRSLWFPGDYLAGNLTDRDGVIIQLTAQWERIDGYCKLSFFSGGKEVITKAVKYGETYKLPKYYETKTGTYCLEWNVTQDGVTKRYKEGTKIKVTEDMKFYAVWDLYTVRFEPNGTGVTDMPNYITTSKNTPITIPDNIPKRDGYRFVGWGTKSAQGDIAFAYEPGEPYDVAVEITLYAMWEEIIISPLKDVLQKKYTSEVMKDEYFDRNYMSSGWQKINDHAYFLIKTDTSLSSYNTDAFVVYKEDYTIRVEEYTDFEGILKTITKHIQENTDNGVGAVATFALDFGVDLVKDLVSSASVGGKIIVYTYDAYSLIKEFIDQEDGAVFDTVEYVGMTGASHAEEFIIKFTVESGVSVSSIISTIYNGAKKIYETKQAEKLNLDPLGDRDVALQTFANSIAKAGWSSAVYDTGLREVVNKMYGK